MGGGGEKIYGEIAVQMQKRGVGDEASRCSFPSYPTIISPIWTEFTCKFFGHEYSEMTPTNGAAWHIWRSNVAR